MLTFGVAGDNNLFELLLLLLLFEEEAPLLALFVVHWEKELDKGDVESFDETDSWFESSMPTSSTGRDDRWWSCWLLLDSMEFLSRLLLKMKFELLFMSFWPVEEASCCCVLISSEEHFMSWTDIKLDDSSFTLYSQKRHLDNFYCKQIGF